MKNCLLWETNC